MNSPAARATQERLSTAAARTRCDVTGPGEVVYIIEGDSQVRERLFTELTASGVAVQSFECPDEYRCFDRGDSAACIVFDVQLLDVFGIDLLRELTSEGAPPLILVSAYPDIQFGVRAIKAGAIDFLIHPVRSDALLCSVNEALSRDRIARQRPFADPVLRPLQIKHDIVGFLAWMIRGQFLDELAIARTAAVSHNNTKHRSVLRADAFHSDSNCHRFLIIAARRHCLRKTGKPFPKMERRD